MRYKVKALSMSKGGGRRGIYNSGDVVTDKHFDAGQAEKLVQEGFLVPFPDDEDGVKLPTADKPLDDLEGDIETGDVEKTDDVETKTEETKTEGNVELSGEVDVEAGLLDKLKGAPEDGETIDKGIDEHKLIVDDLTKAEIIDQLKEKKITFDYRKSKEELFKLLTDAKA